MQGRMKGMQEWRIREREKETRNNENEGDILKDGKKLEVEY